MKNSCAHRKTVKLVGKKNKREQREFSEADLQLTRLPSDFETKLLGKMVIDLLAGHDVYDDPEFDYYIDFFREDIYDAIRSKDPKRITALAATLSPQSILGSGVERPDIFYVLYQIGALLKKFPFPANTAKRKALESFYRQEKTSRCFNQDNYRAVVALSRRHPDWYECIEEIRADILGLMGDEPDTELIFRLAQHGPGTSIGFEGAEGKDTTFFKWLNLPYTVSPDAVPYAKAAIESNPLWVRALFDWYRQKNGLTIYQPIDMTVFWSSVLKLIDYCRYTSVPKTFETERGIAIEPTLNVLMQLGVKALLYARLKRRWGIDLQSQELNQVFARQASKDNDKVTVDLKGASNSVTIMGCALLLPVMWFDLLDDLRSRNIKIPILDSEKGEKTIIRTEMFSAMGNGFTFAIETIIFAAIARYAMRKSGAQGSIAVYGDDIIVPKTAYKVLHELLLLFGFTINEGKTFTDGPFRESCGADCFLGHDVTPLKIDKPIVTVRDLWKVHNSFVLAQKRLPWFYGISFEGTLRWLKTLIPAKFRGFQGPASESVDTYLFVDGKRPHVQGDRTYRWEGITTRPNTYNTRSDAFYFRSLMVDYRPRPEWKVLDPVSAGGSAYDITIRGHVRNVRTSFTGYY